MVNVPIYSIHTDPMGLVKKPTSIALAVIACLQQRLGGIFADVPEKSPPVLLVDCRIDPNHFTPQTSSDRGW